MGRRAVWWSVAVALCCAFSTLGGWVLADGGPKKGRAMLKPMGPEDARAWPDEPGCDEATSRAQGRDGDARDEPCVGGRRRTGRPPERESTPETSGRPTER